MDRLLLEPPKEVQKKIFPWVTEALLQMEEGTQKQRITVINVLKLLKHLRIVILQDAVLMQEKFLAILYEMC